jgi:hypothetical protein
MFTLSVKQTATAEVDEKNVTQVTQHNMPFALKASIATEFSLIFTLFQLIEVLDLVLAR